MDTGELERKLRRNLDTLSSVGLGVIAFGVWSAIEAMILFILQVPKMINETVPGEYAAVGIAISGAGILLGLAINLLLRIYVGRSARAEWLGGKPKRGFLVVAGFLTLGSLISFLITVLAMFLPVEMYAASTVERPDDIFISAVIQLTSLVTLIEMIAAWCRVRHIRRVLKKRRG